MSTWRRLALDSFPELRTEIESPDLTPMLLFFELLPRIRDAHQSGDRVELRRIHEFAAWCARQNEKELWNAAGVGFYEHLVDQPITRNGIPEWVPPDVMERVLPLFQARLAREELTSLLSAYNQRHRTRFRAE